MNLLILLVVLALALALITIVKTLHGENQKEIELPYTKKEYLLTIPERKLFELLKDIAPVNFHVLTQIHLSDLLFVRRNINNRFGYFNRIIKKSVDFVIFNQNFSPILVVELDEKSHSTQKRMERDDFVDTVLKGVGIRILHLRTTDLNYPEKIRDIIQEHLSSNPPTSKVIS